MFTLLWLGVPFLAALLLGGLVGWGPLRLLMLLGVGVLLAAGFVLYAYLSAPVDAYHDTSGCEHCQQFLGRYWEPVFVVFLVVIAYFAWAAGMGIGALIRGLVNPRRREERFVKPS